MEGPEVRVILASNNDDERRLLRRTLELKAGIRVVAEAHNGSETLKLYEAQLPDVVVLDFGLPDTDGIELTSQLLTLHPGARVIIVTSRASHSDYARAALMAGALDVLFKPTEMGMLAGSVRSLYSNARKPPRFLR